MPDDLYIRIALALGLGLLIGMERERADKSPGGVRTFALIALFGAVCGLMSFGLGVWVVVAGFLSLTALAGISNLVEARRNPEHGGGLTTEVAALLTFSVAAYLIEGDKSLAVMMAGVMALLLHFKTPMHSFIDRLSQEEFRSIMQFVLISLVILPVLPNETYGPYDVLNPFKIWLMVVLIVGIGLIAFIAYKLFSSKAGTLLGGLLGGLISSTATTISSARDTKGAPERATAAALIIMIATAVSIVRVLIEVFTVANSHFWAILQPFAVLFGVFLLLTYYIYRKRSDEIIDLDEPSNPARLKPAILFALMYAVILLGVAAGKDHFGNRGLYIIAGLSGLTDVDAITLSTANLLKKGEVEVSTAWRLIMVGTLSNTLFKGAVVAVLGAPELFKRIALLYGISIAAGVAIIFLWPA
ncbi:MgtC/SapB family protein [Haloferula chungangensis]|uniref:MgtC/SapB family protein n=1 Tax=Haloferula chungangensis TaxID=1048331 RepID=A0ABW2L311_9BACT